MARTERERIPRVSGSPSLKAALLTVVDVDKLARGGDLDNVGLLRKSGEISNPAETHVVHVDLLGGTGLGVSLVGGDPEFVTGFNRDLFVSAARKKQAQQCESLHPGHPS